MITKTYRIEDIVFTELSPKKGSIEYFLIDSIKNKRKVTGIAQLGFNRRIKSVRAVNFREKPLIDALVQADIDQRITIDFTEHNKTPRLSVRQARSKLKSGISASKRGKGEITATMNYQEVYDGMDYSEKIKKLSSGISKVGVWSVFLFIIWLAFMAVNQLADMSKGQLF